MKAREKLKRFLAKLLLSPSQDTNLSRQRITAERAEEISDFIKNGLNSAISACLSTGKNREIDSCSFQEEVCNHLYIFFHRYYPNSNISARCEPASTLCLMQGNGQDVGLQWANRDQFFVKTGEDTADYFIHKDLAGLLTRELDRYVKDEMLHLDDLEDVQITRDLSIIKPFVHIGQRIIAYLADTEDFRKKLWLKKKSVIETNYCLTLDRIPKHFYLEIAANNYQREEWVRLFGIDGTTDSSDYSAPLTVEFLDSHPSLMVDTKFFGEAFKERLIGEIQDLSDACDGVIICGEASQALRLIKDSYLNRIDVIMIDPPYNTGTNNFGYKDRFRHSSWLTIMADCLSVCPELLNKDGIFSATIDDNELHHLGLLLNAIFGEHKRVACAPWLSEPSRGKEKTGLRTGHEYILIYRNGDTSAISQEKRATGILNLRDKFGCYRKGRELRKWGGISSRRDRPNQWYALKAPDGKKVYPIKNDGSEGHWRWGKDNESVKAALADPEVFHWEKCAFDKGITYLGKSKRWVPFEKIRTTTKPVGWSAWLDSHGSNADGTRELKNLFGKKVFNTPKPTQLYRWIVSLHRDRNGHILDFFAGSGTTADAVIGLNRADGGSRKYVLVEKEDHFDAVLKPRIQKVVYSENWKGGTPLSSSGGVSHMFKYMRIESYEDCVNKLIACSNRCEEDSMVMVTQEEQGMLCNAVEPSYRSWIWPLFPSFRAKAGIQDLDPGSESGVTPGAQGVSSDPAHRRLKPKKCGKSAMNSIAVDLLETFNFLIGLRASLITPWECFSAAFQPDSNGNPTMSNFRTDPEGPWRFRSAIGSIPDGSRAFVIWRSVSGREKEDDLVLAQWLALQTKASRTCNVRLVYVNGKNNLASMKTKDDAWEVRTIKEEIQRLVWDYGKIDP